MKNLFRLAGTLACLYSAAFAQNNQFSQSRVITGISSTEIAATLQSVGLSARLLSESPDGTKTIEVTAGTDAIYIAMRSCQGAGVEALCEVVQPFGFFLAQGVTLAQINDFNMNASGIATAALMGDGRGIIATKIYLTGGVTQANVTTELGIFFVDIGRLLQAVTPGAIAQVSWRPDEIGAPGVGLDLAGAPPSHEALINKVGAHRGAFMPDAVEALRGHKIGN